MVVPQPEVRFLAATERHLRHSDGAVASPKQRARTNARSESERREAKPVDASAEGSAARNLTSGCGTTTRRAGVWTSRCFVAYADTYDSSSAEDAFRSRAPLRGNDATATAAPAPVPDADATYNSNDLHSWLVGMAHRVAQSAAADVEAIRQGS